MNVRFAIASDLHIALPETIDSNANRFHLTQFSINALEVVLQHLNTENIDFLLLPGDLTQDGEKVNHRWLKAKLATLPYPVYVIPGNHDIPSLTGNETTIAVSDFPHYYQQFGYQNTENLDYTCEVSDGLQLVALNSNQFNAEGKQLGCLSENQFTWLEEILSNFTNKLVLLMIHHNVIEHLPQQSNHILGQRYMLDNASRLLSILEKYQVKFIFTGHLHIQDIATYKNIYEITTGSLITYPHPYRILELKDNQLIIESHRITELPEKKNLGDFSAKWTSDRSFTFMMTILTSPPLNLSVTQAQEYAPLLKHFWADIAHGDKLFNFPELPSEINQYFQKFGAVDENGKPQFIDNNTKINLYQ
ncbi:MAG: metallophosphoesterase [Cyanobacteria bacterium]|nr:metallophosphoesterase [Cyanobacteria bacterium CG_2015-16_32_12]NCO79178.1 metallophosphoesterase [Cyanobacteria bacterium CG_2015-22_32_23]NCQ04920.1 metallophosphoesterase [Cyanobacteria bacterium CG_2015-09_32_10]NCQ41257.1 metallophosphoesterase [Cyanobacteria bacterium CG_2015-04_32_10]NCS84103.1 metallophosphoesterase [Cyanobacteria bacterium CG_2015-02_32_10]